MSSVGSSSAAESSNNPPKSPSKRWRTGAASVAHLFGSFKVKDGREGSKGGSSHKGGATMDIVLDGVGDNAATNSSNAAEDSNTAAATAKETIPKSSLRRTSRYSRTSSNDEDNTNESDRDNTNTSHFDDDDVDEDDDIYLSQEDSSEKPPSPSSHSRTSRTKSKSRGSKDEPQVVGEGGDSGLVRGTTISGTVVEDASESSFSETRIKTIRVSRTPTDRAERAKLKAALLGTFLDSKPKVKGDLETRSASHTSIKSNKSSQSKSSSKDKDDTKEELLSFLSTLPKTESTSDKKKSSSANAAAEDESESGRDPSSPEKSPTRGRRHKIRSTRHGSASSRSLISDAKKASRKDDKKEDIKKSSKHKEDKKEDKPKEGSSSREKDEMRTSTRKLIKHDESGADEGGSGSRSPSKSSLTKSASSRFKISSSIPEAQTLEQLEQIDESEEGSERIPSPRNSPGKRASSSRDLLGTSPRKSSTAMRRAASTREISSPSKSSKSEMSGSRHRSEKSSSLKKKDEQLIAALSPAPSRSKVSSSRERRSSKSNSSIATAAAAAAATGPSEMVIAISSKSSHHSPSSPTKDKSRSKSVDPRRTRRASHHNISTTGTTTTKERGRSRHSGGESGGSIPSSPTKSPRSPTETSTRSRSRPRSVSPVGSPAKDRYAALLKTEDGAAIRNRTQHFTEIQAAEKLEDSPGLETTKAVLSDPTKGEGAREVPSMPDVPFTTDADSPPRKAKKASDKAPMTPSRRTSVAPLVATETALNEQAPTVTVADNEQLLAEYNEEDVFTYYSWSSARQHPEQIQKERMLLRESIRDTPLYRAYFRFLNGASDIANSNC